MRLEKCSQRWCGSHSGRLAAHGALAPTAVTSQPCAVGRSDLAPGPPPTPCVRASKLARAHTCRDPSLPTLPPSLPPADPYLPESAQQPTAPQRVHPRCHTAFPCAHPGGGDPGAAGAKHPRQPGAQVGSAPRLLLSAPAALLLCACRLYCGTRLHPARMHTVTHTHPIVTPHCDCAVLPAFLVPCTLPCRTGTRMCAGTLCLPSTRCASSPRGTCWCQMLQSWWSAFWPASKMCLRDAMRC